MKKIWILLLLGFVLTGCGKVHDKDVIRAFQKKLENGKGYQLKGKLEISNQDEVYSYDVVVDHKKEDYYKVSFVNQANQFQQIILKNDDGVFLLTPSFNRSFKFNSEWPYVNSEIYLLDSLIADIENDAKHTFEKKDGEYIIETSVDYPNHKKLTRQKIFFDEKFQLKKVVVTDSDGVIYMSFVVSKINYNPHYEDDYFDMDSFVDSEEKNENTTKETSVIEDVLYPLMIPSGTKLVGEEKVSKDSGERVIMTYEGEKSFVLVEETLDVFQDFTVIPTMGEPFQLMDTIGVMTDNSLSWTSGNMEYYLVSDVMSHEELLDVAQSIVGVSSFK